MKEVPDELLEAVKSPSFPKKPVQRPVYKVFADIPACGNVYNSDSFVCGCE
jgi:hypothetical protein